MQYVNLDLLNNTDADIPCEYVFNFPNNVLKEGANNYELAVAKADYSTIRVPMFYSTKPLVFQIRASGGSTINGTYNVPAGQYTTITEILKKINTVTSGRIGDFEFDANNEKLRFKSFFSDAVNPTEYLWLSPTLFHLLEGFDIEENNDNVGNKWYVVLNKGTTWQYQEYSTVNRFYNAKTVRLMCSGVYQQDYTEHSNILKESQNTNLLSDQVLSGGERNRIIYIPTQYRYLSLKTNEKLSTIKIYVEIQYSNGEKIPMMLSPGSFFSCLLMFKYNNKNVN